MTSPSENKFTIQDWIARNPSPLRPFSDIPPAWDALEPRHYLSAEEVVGSAANRERKGLVYYLSAAASALLVCLASFYLIYSTGFFPGFSESTNPAFAKVSRAAVLLAFQGRLHIRSLDGNSLEPQVGLALPEGSQIETKEKSTASLSLPAGVLLRISPETHFELQTKDPKEPGLMRTRLKEGKVYSLVERLSQNEGFEIETPTAIAGVRGTSFSVEARAKVTQVQLVLGKVEVRARKAEGAGAMYWVLDQYDKNYVRIGDKSTLEYMHRAEESLEDAKELDDLARLLDKPKIRRMVFSPDALKRNLAVRTERRKLYSLIRLKDGTSVKGFIVAQTGRRLFVETKEKSRILYARDIEEIRFLEE